MTPRTPLEIQGEIERWKAFICEKRIVIETIQRKGDRATPHERIEESGASTDAAGAAIIVRALTWALGEIESLTRRVKIK